MSNCVVLRVDSISKSFPGVQALNNVSFELKKGEIHGLVGENGAGKSTLMKILGGVYQPDSGNIYLYDAKTEIANPRHSISCGISIVYQELNLVPTLNVAENIFLGEEHTLGKTNILDKKAMISKAQSMMEGLGIVNFDCKKLVRDLTISQQQIVEIAKALQLNAQILVMDEPTSILGQGETEILFKLLKKLKSENVSIIYISHRLDEIFQICDRVTILRDGSHIKTLSVMEDQITKNDIIKLMVGRELGHLYNEGKENNIQEDFVLEVENITCKNQFYDISFNLRRGEILGFAGLVGAGRTEVVKAIFGLTKIDTGTIKVEKKEVKIRNANDAMRLNIGFVPEDRKKEGLILMETMVENMTLPSLKKFAMFGFLNRQKQNEITKKYINNMSIRPPLINKPVIHFSGGNQQKIVLAKWLISNPKILILDEPTRGVDVGAKQEIYRLINTLVNSGISIILVSSEMEEILGLSDRIIVLHGGRITSVLNREDANQEIILTKASGLE